MEKYRKAIEAHVCTVCADSDDNGNCTLNENESCGVQLHLPEILKVVRSVDSKYFTDYYKELKGTVCKNCKAKDSTGFCELSSDANCALDRSFQLIVKTIQKVDAGEI